VVNGKRIVTYNDVTDEAVTGPTDPSFTAFLLGVLQSGRPLPLAQSIEEAVKTLTHDPLSIHARVVGQEKYLGRLADIVGFWPAANWSTSLCKGGSSSNSCTHRQRGFGWARLWIDHVHPVLLMYREYGIPLSSGNASISFTASPLLPLAEVPQLGH
jgi:hypothetical protein